MPFQQNPNIEQVKAMVGKESCTRFEIPLHGQACSQMSHLFVEHVSKSASGSRPPLPGHSSPNGRENTSLVSGHRVLDQKNNGQKSHKTRQPWVNRPPASFINERPPFRAATAPRRNLPRRRTQRTRLVAARRSWAARGLSSGRFAVGTCFCTV